MNEDNLKTKLSGLLNEFSMENTSNTQDFVLAEYMLDCLRAYEKAVNYRDRLSYQESLEESYIEATSDSNKIKKRYYEKE